MTPLLAPALALLAMATGESVVSNPSIAEVRRGPLKATLTVSQPVEGRVEVVLRVILRNVSSQPQPFLLERPGAEFFVKDPRGAVVHASAPCFQAGPCNAGLPEPSTLGPGEQLEFVEHWRPGGGCPAPGRYSVKAKLRAFQAPRPNGVVEAGSFASITLLTEFVVRRDGEPGRCAPHEAGATRSTSGIVDT